MAGARIIHETISSLIEQNNNQAAEIEQLKGLVYRMTIINPTDYPKPMEKMIADIYNEKQRMVTDDRSNKAMY